MRALALWLVVMSFFLRVFFSLHHCADTQTQDKRSYVPPSSSSVPLHLMLVFVVWFVWPITCLHMVANFGVKRCPEIPSAKFFLLSLCFGHNALCVECVSNKRIDSYVVWGGRRWACLGLLPSPPPKTVVVVRRFLRTIFHPATGDDDDDHHDTFEHVSRARWWKPQPMRKRASDDEHVSTRFWSGTWGNWCNFSIYRLCWNFS